MRVANSYAVAGMLCDKCKSSQAGASPMLRISVQHECQQFAADILVNDPTGKSSLPAHLPQLTASSEHSAVKEFCLPPPLQSWHDSTSATPALMLRTGLEAPSHFLTSHPRLERCCPKLRLSQLVF